MGSIARSRLDKQPPSPASGDAQIGLKSEAARLTKPASERLDLRFLRGLPKHSLDAVLAAAMPFHLRMAAVVVNQGELASRLFLLTKGSARYFFHTPRGRRLLLMWLKPGDVFGGAALLEHPSSYICGVEVAKGSRILMWERETIRRFVTSCPKLLENALAIASDYLVWYVATHVALTCHTATQRIAQVLTSLAAGLGQQVRGGIALTLTNEELAEAANVTLFTTSRLMAEWQRRGIIRKSRGKILVLSFDRLLTVTTESIYRHRERRNLAINDSKVSDHRSKLLARINQ